MIVECGVDQADRCARVELPETVHEHGVMYLAGCHRCDGSFHELDPVLGGELRFVKYLGVPGDGRTRPVIRARRPADRALGAAPCDPDRFGPACRPLPGADLSPIPRRDGPSSRELLDQLGHAHGEFIT